eukprot:m.330329 g.330329  ORF g.330329 m.330329 type:complete len:181 (+) comp19761_c0_seq3:2117-2659(+)
MLFLVALLLAAQASLFHTAPTPLVFSDPLTSGSKALFSVSNYYCADNSTSLISCSRNTVGDGRFQGCSAIWTHEASSSGKSLLYTMGNIAVDIPDKRVYFRLTTQDRSNFIRISEIRSIDLDGGNEKVTASIHFSPNTPCNGRCVITGVGAWREKHVVVVSLGCFVAVGCFVAEQILCEP